MKIKLKAFLSNLEGVTLMEEEMNECFGLSLNSRRHQQTPSAMHFFTNQ